MTDVREGCGVVIPPLCRCAAAALVAKCGAAAPRREERTAKRTCLRRLPERAVLVA